MKPQSVTGAVEFVSFEMLLRRSDVITLHCPMMRETEGMICRKTISRMKDGVILINVSRRGLVDESDLAEALSSGKVAAAAVDVVSSEPMKADNSLLGAPNLMITPHMAWASVEARTRLVQTVADNCRSWLEGKGQNVL